MSGDGSFAALAEHHLGPILIRAGFAAGQWGAGRRTAASYVVPPGRHPTGRQFRGWWQTVTEPWSESGTYCAAADDYARRHPHFAARFDEEAPYCVDIVVEGTLERGVTRVDVEHERLADVVRGVGRDDEADAVEQALASGDAAAALEVIAAVLERTYLTDPSSPPAAAPG